MKLISRSYYSDDDNKKLQCGDFVFSKGFIIGKINEMNSELDHNSGNISKSRLSQIWSFAENQDFLNNTGC
ncbi:MAG: hypothetical protein K8R25_17075 [Methanosarcinales archaeon]|nr:hypothetical protein [Methanosarcinales archaeon]